MCVITNEEWIRLGDFACDVNDELRKLFFNRQKKFKKTIAKRYYCCFHQLMLLRCYLDDVVGKYYPMNINIIDDIAITAIFYRTKFHPGDSYDRVKNVDIIRGDLNLLNAEINSIISRIHGAKDKLKKINGVINKIHLKLDKADRFEQSLYR
jgi:hypothetical protein